MTDPALIRAKRNTMTDRDLVLDDLADAETVLCNAADRLMVALPGPVDDDGRINRFRAIDTLQLARERLGQAIRLVSHLFTADDAPRDGEGDG